MNPYINYLNKFIRPIPEEYIPSRWVSIAWLPGFFTDSDGFKDGLYPTFWEVQENPDTSHSPKPFSDVLLTVRMFNQEYELQGENCGLTRPTYSIYNPLQEPQSVVLQWLDRRPYFFIRGTNVNVSDENSWPSIENLISGRFIPGGVCVPFRGGSVPFDFGADDNTFSFTWEDALTDFEEDE